VRWGLILLGLVLIFGERAGVAAAAALQTVRWRVVFLVLVACILLAAQTHVSTDPRP
jgi:hypothetical protein